MTVAPQFAMHHELRACAHDGRAATCDTSGAAVNAAAKTQTVRLGSAVVSAPACAHVGANSAMMETEINHSDDSDSEPIDKKETISKTAMKKKPAVPKAPKAQAKGATGSGERGEPETKKYPSGWTAITTIRPTETKKRLSDTAYYDPDGGHFSSLTQARKAGFEEK